MDWDGRRQILALELAIARAAGLPRRLEGARPQGRRTGRVLRPSRPDRAIGEVIPEAAWQRCYVHFVGNSLDHLPRKHRNDCLQELRRLYHRHLAEVRSRPPSCPNGRPAIRG
ncbi:MAG: hypothetical protein EOR47_22785 [Mesorhizobium sp.]|nr:MAG: hypothetical protein EOR47_22785 [Mesorhizobium sp.]